MDMIDDEKGAGNGRWCDDQESGCVIRKHMEEEATGREESDVCDSADQLPSPCSEHGKRQEKRGKGLNEESESAVPK
jgi:hypothetical protein